MDNQEKLAGKIAEVMEPKMKALEDKLEESKETNAKLAEENKEWRESMDKLQGQKYAGKDGQVYKFGGYNTDFNKNFKATLTYEEADVVAKAYLDAAQGKVIDFSSIMPAGFGSSLLGLGELTSSSLSTMRVVPITDKTFTAPVKGTRETVDAQSPGTARTSTSITAGKITFTIDKIIGSYVDVLRTDVRDATVTLVNDWIIPMQGEAIGQYTDGEVFNGTNSIYTTSIVDVTSGGVTASGSAGISTAMTFDNLNTMYYGLEWERVIGDPLWYGSRASLKSVSALVDSNGQPIFQQVPINGRPSQTLLGSQFVITPTISDTPAAGAMRLCFGDPSQYIITTRGGIEDLINPYILLKEDTVQFIANFESDGNVADNATAANSGAWSNMRRVDA